MTLVLRRARLVAGARRVGPPGPVDPAPELVDVVVDGGVIAALEPGAEAPRGAASVDLDGRWVHPGLWDGHVHSGQVVLAARRLDVSRAGSAAEVAALVRSRLAERPPAPGEVLLGFGFRDALWPDAPDPALLEIGDAPVALVSGDVHAVWSNRAALATIGRGAHDWFLREQDAFDANVAYSLVPDAVLDRWAAEEAQRWAARGVVGIHDLEMHDALGAWARRVARGIRGIRVRAGVYPDGFESAVDARVRTGRPIEGTAGLVEGGNFKLFTDGALNTRTAWCADPYPGVPAAEAHGLATYELDELVARARAALAVGLVPTIHAIGDLAVTQALDAIASLGPAPTGTRHRIEHAQLVADVDVPRFAALGVVASVQPEHAMDDRDVADRYWAGSAARAFRYRDLLDAGVELALGSDAPVAPLDPWVAIAAAVSRSRDGREPWHAEQALPVSAALAASTGGAGPLAVGRPADLVVLDADPLTADGEALRAMPVAGTLLAGEWTHRAI